jgi:hypothetical protein
MIVYRDKNSNLTSKYNRSITDNDRLVNLGTEYSVFKEAFKDYLKTIHNIKLKETTLQYIFLEVLYRLYNNSTLDFSSTEILDILDYAIGEDLVIDNYLDLSDIIDYNSIINDIFNNIIVKNINLTMTDYIAYHSTLYMVLNPKTIEVINTEKAFLTLPSEIETLFISLSIDLKSVENLIFFNKLIDTAILIVRSNGQVVNEEGLILDIINNYQLYSKSGSLIRLAGNEYTIEISIIKSSLYHLVDGVLNSKLLIDSKKVIVETILNRNIVILVEKG